MVVTWVWFQSLAQAWAAAKRPKAGRRDWKDFILTGERLYVSVTKVGRRRIKQTGGAFEGIARMNESEILCLWDEEERKMAGDARRLSIGEAARQRGSLTHNSCTSANKANKLNAEGTLKAHHGKGELSRCRW